jgi:hypothetical protein
MPFFFGVVVIMRPQFEWVHSLLSICARVCESAVGILAEVISPRWRGPFIYYIIFSTSATGINVVQRAIKEDAPALSDRAAYFRGLAKFLGNGFM